MPAGEFCNYSPYIQPQNLTMKPNSKGSSEAPGQGAGNPDEELITTSDVMIEFAVSERTIYNWLQEGIIHRFKTKGKGRNYFKRGEVRRAWKKMPAQNELKAAESSPPKMETPPLVWIGTIIGVLTFLFSPHMGTANVAAVIVLLILIYYGALNLKRLPLNRTIKTWLWVLVILLPPVGYIAVLAIAKWRRKS
jgi:hypothetical protein